MSAENARLLRFKPLAGWMTLYACQQRFMGGFMIHRNTLLLFLVSRIFIPDIRELRVRKSRETQRGSRPVRERGGISHRRTRLSESR
jgi:hypothetical protein